jgi:hypothetical protein
MEKSLQARRYKIARREKQTLKAKSDSARREKQTLKAKSDSA